MVLTQSGDVSSNRWFSTCVIDDSHGGYFPETIRATCSPSNFHSSVHRSLSLLVRHLLCRKSLVANDRTSFDIELHWLPRGISVLEKRPNRNFCSMLQEGDAWLTVNKVSNKNSQDFRRLEKRGWRERWRRDRSTCRDNFSFILFYFLLFSFIFFYSFFC